MQFPDYGQSARFGVAGNDRQGYAAAAYGNHLAYVSQQGRPGMSGDGSVVIETFTGDYSTPNTDASAWTGNLDHAGGVLPGSITVAAPADASGFGYGVAMDASRLVISAKWSQQVFVYDLNGVLQRTINAPVDDDRVQADNFAESVALNGDMLAIGAPNSTVDGKGDAGAVFTVDLGNPTSAPAALLPAKGDPSIKEGALAGQSVAVKGTMVAAGLPGYVTKVGDASVTTGLVQLYQANVWKADLVVDPASGSYPSANGPSMAGLGRALAFSNDGSTLYAADPSWDSATTWGAQRGAVLAFNTESGAIAHTITLQNANYFGGSLAVGDAEAGNDTLFVAYRDTDGDDKGRVRGYAVASDGAVVDKATLQPSDAAGDVGFGSLGLLGGSIVPYSVVGQDGAKHRRLFVTSRDANYNFETQHGLSLTKSVNPGSGTRVFPGQKLTYTLTATNSNPKGSLMETTVKDDLTDVLAYSKSGALEGLNAVFDPSTSTPAVPNVDLGSKTLVWSGSIPGGSSLTITYSIVVGKSEKAKYYDGSVKNVFSSDRSQDVPATNNPLGKIDTTLGIEDADGNPVPAGTSLGKDQDYVYVVTVGNDTDTDAPAFSATGDLNGIVDDGTVGQSGISTDSGSAVYDPATGKVTWNGTVPSGKKVKIKIPFHTNAAGTSPNGDSSIVGNVDNPLGPNPEQSKDALVDVGLKKEVYKANGSQPIATVKPGAKMRYDVVYENTTGVTLGKADILDDLSNVLKSATGPTDLSATSSDSAHVLKAPTFNAAKKQLQWSGTGLKPGERVTLSYTVTVRRDVERDVEIHNAVSSPQTSLAPSTTVKTLAAGETVGTLPLTGKQAWILLLCVLVGLVVIGASYVIRRKSRSK
ncbi:isopeptide-forming domain-containing fimbrial protein [Bifidobacterium sp. ESL0682]|uniref:isopeptide-forming domain-containing fimbrial protein n=1 Tax=Bifidobacterium sp. ESL0682 TaxID=2983212 RepID=UPI0023F7839F|nr:isopeptide-forming domain-containing fimbrial protein [Bifidobacterium sp. ESL0682]WEV41883.1 isopeptide-forming domain-containing fimbrial protein [Bifidobacterium sp. ESL0682]